MEKLLQELQALKGQEIEPNIVRKTLLSHDLRNLQYKQYLQGADMNSYNRINLIDEPLQAFIMIRPPQHHLPIHQHNNFWGFIIPLEGIVSETMYNYDTTKGKVYIHPTKMYSTGDYIYEPFNLLHKLQNTSPIDPAITFHVRYPSKYDYDGTMILDAKNRKMAILNHNARQVGWDLPRDHYQSMEENAYELEKLW
ncbi:MAG: hypothetical protein R6U64_06705 [Bacteroidales bacterium]